jgi:chromosome segregation ATPase
VLGEAFEVRWWQTQIDDARNDALAAQRLAAKAREEADAEKLRGRDAARRLLDAEEIVARSGSRIEALEAEFARVRVARDETDQEIEKLNEDVEKLAVELARSRRVMDEMKDSVSWRISAPLRGLKRLVLKLRRRR